MALLNKKPPEMDGSFLMFMMSSCLLNNIIGFKGLTISISKLLGVCRT